MTLDEEEEKREIDPGKKFPQDIGNDNDKTGAEDSRNLLLMKKLPSMLPVITPELLKEHHIQKQAAHYSFAWRNNHEEEVGQAVEDSCLRYFCCPCQRQPYDDQHVEPSAICGIPYYLFMILAALLAAVTAGAVMAVLFYDPKSGIQPPSLSPSAPPSFLPGTGDPLSP